MFLGRNFVWFVVGWPNDDDDYIVERLNCMNWNYCLRQPCVVCECCEDDRMALRII